MLVCGAMQFQRPPEEHAASARKAPLWAQALGSADAFREEQAQIGKVWTLLGFASDVSKDGDWFRSTLGGRSVFVQRFKDELRGFENVCAHRFFPLRTKDKGNGPIRCGFHHWQYNKDGLAVGIPNCVELFGVIPRELGTKLKPLEIAVCGKLIFGRFPSAEHRESLEEYLGPGFDILKAMWSGDSAPYVAHSEIKANWKLGHHISLDDYHIVAVHPDSFGKHGYHPVEKTKYFRFGRHSAYFWGASEGVVNDTAAQCRAGTYRPTDYRILQFFPNLVAVHFEAAGTWYVLLQQYVPVAHDRTLLRSIYQEAPFPPQDANFLRKLMRKIAAPFLPWIVPLYLRKIIREDNEVCEKLQTSIAQIEGPMILGKQEECIAWFEENYAEVVGEIGRND